MFRTDRPGLFHYDFPPTPKLLAALLADGGTVALPGEDREAREVPTGAELEAVRKLDEARVRFDRSTGSIEPINRNFYSSRLQR